MSKAFQSKFLITLQNGIYFGNLLKKLEALEGIRLIASGGVSGAEDLRKLSAMGVYGAITGKALYEGKVTMEEIREIQE